MNGWHLFRWVLWRGIISGAVLGALFGSTITSIYILTGAIGICFISFFAGALLGAGLGGILSVVNGIVLVTLTHFFPNPCRCRWSALLVSLITTAISSLLAVHLLFGDLPFVLMPVTVLAAIVAGYFAWRLPDADSTPSILVRRPPANAVLFYIEK